MIDDDALRRALAGAGLERWAEPLSALAAARLSPAHHGDFERWQDALESLDPDAADTAGNERALKSLIPWRKGPFDLGGVTIDAEWRSDRKWARVAPALDPLGGRRVLDVGGGNGYYAYRMREAGAAFVLGIDPTLLYVMQFLAVARFHPDPAIQVLPLRLAELPDASHGFETVFSMGVLYHQRSPIEHLRELKAQLKPGGQLVLETLILPGDEAFARTPGARYARMKNVWLLPSMPELLTWLGRTGYRDIRAIDRTGTTTDEQRATDWMPYESLADALDPSDPSKTVEGWPAPLRAVLTARVPG